MTSHKFDLPSDYNLDVDDDFVNEIISEFRESCDGARQALQAYGSGDHCKWPTVEEDLAEFSEKHPDLLMVITGEGEERSDLWNLYAKDGKTEICYVQLFMPEPDMLEDYD